MDLHLEIHTTDSQLKPLRDVYALDYKFVSQTRLFDIEDEFIATDDFPEENNIPLYLYLVKVKDGRKKKNMLLLLRDKFENSMDKIETIRVMMTCYFDQISFSVIDMGYIFDIPIYCSMDKESPMFCPICYSKIDQLLNCQCELNRFDKMLQLQERKVLIKGAVRL